MKVGCVKEIKRHEYRVGMTPHCAKSYVDHGHQVTIQAGAGADATYPRSSPLPFNGKVYIGNGAGFEEQYECIGSASGSFAR